MAGSRFFYICSNFNLKCISMGRMARDPWAKKTAAGMRTLGKMTGAAYKVGKAVYKASSQKTPSRPLPQQQQPREVDWKMMGGLLGGVVVLLIIVLNSEIAFFGFLLGLPVMCVLSVVFVLILDCIFPKKKGTYVSQEKINSASASSSLVVADMAVANKIKDALLSNHEYSDLADLCKTMSTEKKRVTLECGFNKAVLDIVEGGSILEQAEDNIQGIVNTMGLSLGVLQKLPSWESFVKMLVINDLLCGKTPDRITGTDVIPVNLQRNEVVVWCFFDVWYYESCQKCVNYGKSHGLSVRIAKGLYYRVGAFKGEPVITTGQRLISNGCLLLTNKNIYFYSGDKSLRVPYAKIVAYVPYEDGLGVQKDAVSAKSMTFVGLDGWFVYNIVKNISNIE